MKRYKKTTTYILKMSDNKEWKGYDYTDPKEMEKCRQRQKLYYEKRKNTIVTCNACKTNHNDFTIYKHFKTKKHQLNDPQGLYFGFPNSNK